MFDTCVALGREERRFLSAERGIRELEGVIHGKDATHKFDFELQACSWDQYITLPCPLQMLSPHRTRKHTTKRNRLELSYSRFRVTATYRKLNTGVMRS